MNGQSKSYKNCIAIFYKYFFVMNFLIVIFMSITATAANIITTKPGAAVTEWVNDYDDYELGDDGTIKLVLRH